MPAHATLLDVPMIGGVKICSEASLVLIAAGDKQVVETVAPVLRPLARSGMLVTKATALS